MLKDTFQTVTGESQDRFSNNFTSLDDQKSANAVTAAVRDYGQIGKSGSRYDDLVGELPPSVFMTDDEEMIDLGDIEIW